MTTFVFLTAYPLGDIIPPFFMSQIDGGRRGRGAPTAGPPAIPGQVPNL